MSRRLYIDEFYRSYEIAMEWEDVPEPEKQKAIYKLRHEVGIDYQRAYLKRRRELNDLKPT